MRIVEPNKFSTETPEKDTPANKKPLPKKAIVVLALFLIVGGFVVVFSRNEDPEVATAIEPTTETEEGSSTLTTQVPGQEAPTSEFRQFSGNEFRVFYDNLLQPNLDRVDTPPEISGDDVADTRIRQIAETRGYRLRSSPSVQLSSIQGYAMQQAVIQPWLDLQAAGAAAGHQMSIVSAYRSVDTQRSLFLSRLSAQGASIAQVAAGQADEAVNEVLVTSSIPGYSKHHTGYTIDVQCAGFAFESFVSSPCFTWLSANNYENAKKHGFIPSYPEDADLQGPDPEAWEYVYVGSDLLRN